MLIELLINELSFCKVNSVIYDSELKFYSCLEFCDWIVRVESNVNDALVFAQRVESDSNLLPTSTLSLSAPTVRVDKKTVRMFMRLHEN